MVVIKRVFTDISRARALVIALVERTVLLRYRGSMLGFLWSLLNPLLQMAVYSVVFQYVMRTQAVEHYAVFLLCGLIPWTFTLSAINEGAMSVVQSGSLITKSLFPPIVLPTVTVLSGLIHLLCSLPILMIFLVAFHSTPSFSWLLLPVVIVLQAVLLLGIVYTVAAGNVFFRDLQHVLGHVLSVLFFLTPIVYPFSQIPERFHWALYANPMTLIAECYHQILYYETIPGLKIWGALGLWALAFFWLGATIFAKVQEGFAEKL